MKNTDIPSKAQVKSNGRTDLTPASGIDGDPLAIPTIVLEVARVGHREGKELRSNILLAKAMREVKSRLGYAPTDRLDEDTMLTLKRTCENVYARVIDNLVADGYTAHKSSGIKVVLTDTGCLREQSISFRKVTDWPTQLKDLTWEYHQQVRRIHKLQDKLEMTEEDRKFVVRESLEKAHDRLATIEALQANVEREIANLAKLQD